MKIPTKRMWYTCFGLVVVDYISRGTLSVPISVPGPTFPFLAYSVWNMLFLYQLSKYVVQKLQQMCSLVLLAVV